MGIVLKIIGLLLLLGGLYGLFVTIPKLVVNVALDQINPLVIFGLVESGTPASIFDLILSFLLIGVGVILIKKHNAPINIKK